jgi:hypothetical protein
MLLTPIQRREFELYALALPSGPNFDPRVFHSAWKAGNSISVGVILANENGRFDTIAMRRQVDHRFVVVHERNNLPTVERATDHITQAMRPEAPPEPLKPGIKKRPFLFPKDAGEPGDTFKLITTTIQHLPALMTIGETYLAMPRPDDNFVPDFRGSNFDSRLWELYLLACFREQGTHVAQEHPSPDFYIEREGHNCFVEAVTANASEVRPKGFPRPVSAPEDNTERLLGAPAVRFAKTLRSKLQRDYEGLPHVAGKPFALAIADFHASGSMVWSREALPCYLYGIHPHVIDGPDGPKAIMPDVQKLLSEQNIPAGLFRDPTMAHLSAVIFSNAATISKFNRMGFLAGWRPPGVSMVREGHLFDRTPGALKSIPFKMDILSDEYASLWPGGEAWCQELEVLHNPLAKYPIDFNLIPGATHWFEKDGELQCSSVWEWSVLSSITILGVPKIEERA